MQRSACLYLSGSEVASIYLCPWLFFFLRLWGINLRSCVWKSSPLLTELPPMGGKYVWLTGGRKMITSVILISSSFLSILKLFFMSYWSPIVTCLFLLICILVLDVFSQEVTSQPHCRWQKQLEKTLLNLSQEL